MLQEQIFQLKIASLIEANKTGALPDTLVGVAEDIYQWLIKEVTEEAAAKAAKVEAQALVK